VSSATILRPSAFREGRSNAASIVGSTHAEDLWPHTTRALPWLLAGFLTMIWVVPFGAISLPMAGHPDRPALVAIGGIWILTLGVVVGPARPRVRVTLLHVAIALLFACAVASVALNSSILANLGELGLASKKLVLLASFAIFFVMVASVIRPAEVPRFVGLMLGLAAVVSIAAIVEYRLEVNPFYDLAANFPYIAVPSDLHEIDPTGRTTVYGPMDHPLELALMLGLVVPFALVPLLEVKTRPQQLRWLLLTGVLLAGIFATQRKTGLIAAGIGAIAVVAMRPRLLRQAVQTGIGLMLILHLLAPGAMGSLRQQLEPSRFSNTKSVDDRSEDYDAIKPDLARHPALGRGFGSYDPYKYRILDNQYLGLLVTVGLVGTAAYGVVLLAAMASARRRPEGRRGPPGLATAQIGAVAVFAVGGALFDVLSFPHVTYAFFFLLGLIAVGRPRPADTADETARAP
jgi:hypothetical protein